jgi:hypothetical protein
MTEQRHPTDNAIIDQAGEPPVPSHQGSAGGNLARKVGERDELKTADGGDPLPTSVDGRDKPDGGDRPTPPQHHE